MGNRHPAVGYRYAPSMTIDGNRVRVIAEVGQAAGDVAYAVQAAEAFHKAGCWGLKIQVLDPERIATPDAAKYWATQPGDESSQRAVFARNGVLDRGAVREVFAECRRVGIAPLGTPFDVDAVTVLADGGVAALKIASGDITFRRLLDAVADTGLPVILSTGASTDLEVQRAWQHLNGRGCRDVTVLACGLVYPCPDGDAHLRRILYLRASFGTRVGYSDHTLGVDTGMVAAGLGAVVLEKHVTLSQGGGSPDDEMALLPDEMAVYVERAEVGARLAGDYGFHVSPAEQPARVGARRSVRWARDLPAGHTISPADLVELRPHVDEGFDPWYADHLVGRVLAVPVEGGGLVGRVVPLVRLPDEAAV